MVLVGNNFDFFSVGSCPRTKLKCCYLELILSVILNFLSYFFQLQAMSPVHSPASAREDDHKHQAAADLKFSSKPGSDGQSQKNSLFKKPDINQYKI